MRCAKVKMDKQLFANIKQQLPVLETLFEEISGHWVYEDLVYRFYHGSFKVYALQEITLRIADALKELAPEGKAFCRESAEICGICG